MLKDVLEIIPVYLQDYVLSGQATLLVEACPFIRGELGMWQGSDPSSEGDVVCCSCRSKPDDKQYIDIVYNIFGWPWISMSRSCDRIDSHLKDSAVLVERMCSYAGSLWVTAFLGYVILYLGDSIMIPVRESQQRKQELSAVLFLMVPPIRQCSFSSFRSVIPSHGNNLLFHIFQFLVRTDFKNKQIIGKQLRNDKIWIGKKMTASKITSSLHPRYHSIYFPGHLSYKIKDMAGQHVFTAKGKIEGDFFNCCDPAARWIEFDIRNLNKVALTHFKVIFEELGCCTYPKSVRYF